jgi:hypothetical protein
VSKTTSSELFTRNRVASALVAALACVMTLMCLTQSASAKAHTADVQSSQPAGEKAPAASATLEQCMTSVVQAERSATFSGEITAIPGSTHMAMRIEVQERTPAEAMFHTVTAPGLGVWRASDPGVKNYKYLKQVTNLAAPAVYRATVRFRWLNANGHLLRRTERHTPVCAQPAGDARMEEQ